MASENTHTNALIHETSPYLLQHAHNPVNWYPWGKEAIEKARQENKPILVSIGYAACHWCHVMAHESFEDPDTATHMNEWFVNIKVDREERPDLDQIYMDALQAMNGQGGWPLNVFLTPDLKPFYGGTYFPPVNSYGRLSWKNLLTTIHDAYINKYDTVILQAGNLMQHLHTANAIGTPRSNPGLVSVEHLQEAEKELLTIFDQEYGGFSKAPKFPQTLAIQYLLRQYYHSKNQEALHAATFSLDKMISGGLYDHLAGGFARYSTDKYWQAPHFEKMLYDNAMLVSTLSEAYGATENEQYETTIRQTINFLINEMLSPEGGFYSSIDADSEGKEGKFYTWSRNEIETILGKDADTFCQVYDIWEDGNWEKTNIIWRPNKLEKTALQNNILLDELKTSLSNSRAKLLEIRNTRIRPMTDDKILLGWNALTIKALCDAGMILQQDSYVHIAERTMEFLEKNMLSENGMWMHSWKANTAKIPAFLDDYGALIQGYIGLQEATGNPDYLHKAVLYTDYVLQHFSSTSTLFFYTAKEQDDVVLRKKEIYDGATPSGNSLMAHNLYYLSVMVNKPDWADKAKHMLLSVGGGMIHYPTSFGNWDLLLQKMVYHFKEIAIIGDNYKILLKEVNSLYIPDKLIVSSEKDYGLPLLQERLKPGKTLIYLCKDYSCQQPVESLEELEDIL
ncbi:MULTISPECIES: thioredoxin domain-containing protein [Chitinophagaceae]